MASSFRLLARLFACGAKRVRRVWDGCGGAVPSDCEWNARRSRTNGDLLAVTLGGQQGDFVIGL